jgi:hypothetical protein
VKDMISRVDERTAEFGVPVFHSVQPKREDLGRSEFLDFPVDDLQRPLPILYG